VEIGVEVLVHGNQTRRDFPFAQKPHF
jgi:hypothetical protein